MLPSEQRFLPQRRRPTEANFEEPALKRSGWVIVKWWLLGAGLLAVLVWLNRQSLKQIASQWHDFDPSQIVIATILFLAGAGLCFFRWYLLVRSQELPFRQVDAVRLGFISLFFSAFLPGSIGGDLVKAGLLAREQARRTIAVATIIVDRVVGLYGLLLLASLVGIVFWNEAGAVVDSNGQTPLRWIVRFVWLVTLGITLVGTVLVLMPMRGEAWMRRLERVPRLGHVLVELVHSARMYRHRGRYVLVATGLAVIGHIGFVLSFYFAARAVPKPIPTFEQHWLIVPVGMVVESVPLTPGGIGVGEAAYEYLYRVVGGSSGQFDGKGVSARIAQRVVNYAVALVGLGFYIPLRRTVRQVLIETEGESPAESKEGPSQQTATEKRGEGGNEGVP